MESIVALPQLEKFGSGNLLFTTRTIKHNGEYGPHKYDSSRSLFLSHSFFCLSLALSFHRFLGDDSHVLYMLDLKEARHIWFFLLHLHFVLCILFIFGSNTVYICTLAHSQLTHCTQTDSLGNHNFDYNEYSDFQRIELNSRIHTN